MTNQPDRGGVVDTGVLAGRDGDALGSTGGSSGGGTIAGDGDPSGGTLDRAPELADERDDEIAREAAALGGVDGSLTATATGGSAVPTGAKAIGSGAGRGEVGSGTPGDRSETGGGDPLRTTGQ